MTISTHKDRLKCAISNTPGASGALTVAAAAAGFQGFAAADDGKTFDCVFVDGSAWEVRAGCVYTHSGTSLSRGTLLASSTGGAILLTASTIVSDSLSASKMASIENQLDRGFTSVANAVGTGQSLAAGGNIKLTTALGSIAANPYSWWDDTNKRFKPTRPGLYAFNFVARGAGGSGSTVWQGNVSKNGSSLQEGIVFTASDALMQVAGVANMNGTTDYLEFNVYTAGGGSLVTMSDVARRVFLDAYFISTN